MSKKDPKVGTGKKPKGSGRRLYTDENPKDKVSIKYATVKDAFVEDTKYASNNFPLFKFVFHEPSKIVSTIFNLSLFLMRVITLIT